MHQTERLGLWGALLKTRLCPPLTHRIPSLEWDLGACPPKNFPPLSSEASPSLKSPCSLMCTGHGPQAWEVLPQGFVLCRSCSRKGDPNLCWDSRTLAGPWRPGLCGQSCRSPCRPPPSHPGSKHSGNFVSLSAESQVPRTAPGTQEVLENDWMEGKEGEREGGRGVEARCP